MKKGPEFGKSYKRSITEEYKQKGYVKFDEVIDPDEARGLGAELSGLILGKGNNAQWKGGFNSEEESTKAQIFDMHDVQDHETSGNFKRLLHDPRIMSRLSILLGGPVILHHDKGFVKPRATGDTYGGKFPPHQDYPFFPHENYNMLAAIVYLTDITEDMGPVRVFPESHRNGPIEHLRTENGTPYLDDAPYPLDEAVAVTGKAGDMVAFNLNTVHISGPNKSNRDRISWLLQVRGNGSKRVWGDTEPHEGEILWPSE